MITGGLNLYKPEIERIVYREWLARPSNGPALPVSAIVADVERTTGASVTQLALPAAADESWRLTIEDGAGRHTAFVDPGSGRVLGIAAREGRVMKLDRDLHSLAITGPIGNALIEIVARWAIVLVLTGFYLWWPRKGSPALALRGAPRNGADGGSRTRTPMGQKILSIAVWCTLGFAEVGWSTADVCR